MGAYMFRNAPDSGPGITRRSDESTEPLRTARRTITRYPTSRNALRHVQNQSWYEWIWSFWDSGEIGYHSSSRRERFKFKAQGAAVELTTRRSDFHNDPILRELLNDSEDDYYEPEHLIEEEERARRERVMNLSTQLERERENLRKLELRRKNKKKREKQEWEFSRKQAGVYTTQRKNSPSKAPEELSEFQKTLETFCDSVISHCKTRFNGMKFPKDDGTEANFLRHFLSIESDILRFKMRRATQELDDTESSLQHSHFSPISSCVKSRKNVVAYLKNIQKELAEIKEMLVYFEKHYSLLAFLITSLWNQNDELQVMGIDVFEDNILRNNPCLKDYLLDSVFDMELSGSVIQYPILFEISTILEKLNLKSMNNVMEEYFSDE